jgi:hypothetical protein
MMRTRLPFSWNPAWFHAGASLWCLAAKVAYVATARVEAVLKLLTGADEHGRTRAWVASKDADDIVQRQFELTSAEARALFLHAKAHDLEERQHINIGLRWCPSCLASWYHHPKFQDRRVRRCPWHNERLRDVCQHCSRAIDPLGRPWRCGHCSKPLVANPETWLTGFKTRPDHDGRWPRSLPTSMVAYKERERGVLCMPDVDEEVALASHSRAVDYWTHAQLYESTAALWDTVLRDHHECALEDTNVYNRHYYWQSFGCPVAAAARTVFGQMYLGRTLDGVWPTQCTVRSAFNSLATDGPVSLEVRRAMLRELPRAWLADALLLFGEVARTGRLKARWEPHPDAVWAKTMSLSGSFTPQLVTKRPTKWVEATVAFTAELCPDGKATRRTRDALKILLD